MGRLSVRVVSGSNLEAKDLGGTSDPYVIVRCSGQQHKTRVINRNLNPVWNDTFNFNNVDPHSSVVFNVYDHDLVGSNDPMGEAHFQCSQIMQNGMPQQLTIPLQRAKRGMLTVEITAYDFPIQGGYPSQQMGYPPQQMGYPPQQQMGYPPQQQMGYPPQQMHGMPPQQGYPPQQMGYPPQQMHGGYPPQNMHMHGGHHDGKKYKDPHKVKDPHKIKDPHKKKHKDPSKKLMKEMKSGVKDVGKEVFKALF